jgi:hypothetical protein
VAGGAEVARGGLGLRRSLNATPTQISVILNSFQDQFLRATGELIRKTCAPGLGFSTTPDIVARSILKQVQDHVSSQTDPQKLASIGTRMDLLTNIRIYTVFQSSSWQSQASIQQYRFSVSWLVQSILDQTWRR